MSIRFKLDENLARDVEMELRKSGHDVRTALEQGLGGGNDDDLLVACRAEERILITLDLDFADVRTYPPMNQPGISGASSADSESPGIPIDRTPQHRSVMAELRTIGGARPEG